MGESWNATGGNYGRRAVSSDISLDEKDLRAAMSFPADQPFHRRLGIGNWSI